VPLRGEAKDNSLFTSDIAILEVIMRYPEMGEAYKAQLAQGYALVSVGLLGLSGYKFTVLFWPVLGLQS